LDADPEVLDRWLEQANEDASLLISQAKYDVERREIARALRPAAPRLLGAA
jgi:hypothetical protein